MGRMHVGAQVGLSLSNAIAGYEIGPLLAFWALLRGVTEGKGS